MLDLDQGDISLRDFIERTTHGQPPNRGCLGGSVSKWNGYLLGVEDAIQAAETWTEARIRQLTNRGRSAT